MGKCDNQRYSFLRQRNSESETRVFSGEECYPENWARVDCFELSRWDWVAHLQFTLQARVLCFTSWSYTPGENPASTLSWRGLATMGQVRGKEFHHNRRWATRFLPRWVQAFNRWPHPRRSWSVWVQGQVDPRLLLEWWFDSRSSADCYLQVKQWVRSI